MNYQALGIKNPTAYSIKVPNECVSILLGEGGKVINQIKE